MYIVGEEVLWFCQNQREWYTGTISKIVEGKEGEEPLYRVVLSDDNFRWIFANSVKPI